MRSLNLLRKLDLVGAFTYLDFHQSTIIQNRFPQIKDADFESAMYFVDSDGSSHRGFFAFRRLLWRSPLLWLFIPLFYFPGASFFGPKIYAWIAENRTRLSRGSSCKIK
jgi:predicted DCC family thiol-disulfide oxidoreductase YuxK